MRNSIQIALILLIYFWFSPAKSSEKPNVLFIISDDLTAEALGCYGNLQSKTPNIDALAKRGVRFTRAYCQYGVCGASRASMMSGMFPQAIDVITNPEASDPDRFAKNLGDRPSMSQAFFAGWIFHRTGEQDLSHARTGRSHCGDSRTGSCSIMDGALCDEGTRAME